MTIEYRHVEVTPALAAEILSRNTHNRNLRVLAVATIASDMTAGRWDSRNGETVKIAADGTLVDGQHRLNAVVAAGVTVTMTFAYGVSMKSQETVDIGRRRTFADMLVLRGEKQGIALSAAILRVHLWKLGYRTSKVTKISPSFAELFDTLNEHPEIRESVDIATRVRKSVPLFASVLSLTHWLTDQIDAEDCAFFFERLSDGHLLASDHPIAVLRRTMFENAASIRKQLSSDMQLAYTLKTWNYYREGRSITFLRYKPGGAHPDVFPEPK